MKRKVTLVSMLLLFVFVLTGCWQGEVFVDTTFNADGSGERIFQLTVYDDTLADEAIPNPEDPTGEKGHGPVINDKHIVGGLPAMQTWFEENAPDFMEVHDMETDEENYLRIYTLSFAFDDFDEFLERMETLVNLSPVMSWEDFDADELPAMECDGMFFTETCTFTESREIVEASLDWAIDGIWNDIYDADDLEGFVEKGDIAVFADYRTTVFDSTYEEMGHYDPDAEDPDHPDIGGLYVYVDSDFFEVVGERTNSAGISIVVAGAIIVIGLAVGAVYIFKLKS